MAAPAAPALVPEAPSQSKSKTPVQKKPKTPKAAPAHPSYLQMSAEAIGALKDRTGSSQQAIAKWVEEKYKGTLPSNFKKQLSVQLKKLSQNGKLVQIKHSYKLSDELKKPAKPVKTTENKPIAKKVVKAPKSPKAVKKSGVSKAVKPKSVKLVKSAKPAVKPVKLAKPLVKPAAKTTAPVKKVVKKAAPAAKKVVKAVPPKKPVLAKKVAPKKLKSVKKAVKPKTAPAKKAKVAA